MRERFVSGGHFMKGCNFAQCQPEFHRTKASLVQREVARSAGGIVPGIDLICKAGDYSGIIQPLYSGKRPSGMPSFFS